MTHVQVERRNMAKRKGKKKKTYNNTKDNIYIFLILFMMVLCPFGIAGMIKAYPESNSFSDFFHNSLAEISTLFAALIITMILGVITLVVAKCSENNKSKEKRKKKTD